MVGLTWGMASPSLLHYQGKALLAAGKPQDAVTVLTAGLIKDPSDTAANADRKTAEECVQRVTLAKQCLAKKQYVQVSSRLVG